MRRQRYGDGIRNGLRVGLLLAALVGLFHAVGVGKALLYLGSGRKRGQHGHAEFNAYRGLLGPVLRIGIGDRGRGRVLIDIYPWFAIDPILFALPLSTVAMVLTSLITYKKQEI